VASSTSVIRIFFHVPTYTTQWLRQVHINSGKANCRRGSSKTDAQIHFTRRFPALNLAHIICPRRSQPPLLSRKSLIQSCSSSTVKGCLSCSQVQNKSSIPNSSSLTCSFRESDGCDRFRNSLKGNTARRPYKKNTRMHFILIKRIDHSEFH
jgi:hypothetical protein